MRIAFILIGIVLIIIATIYILEKKNTNQSTIYNNYENEEPTKLDILNEIIGLRNQISWTNLWLFFIALILFCKYVIPFILKIAGITYIANELSNIIN